MIVADTSGLLALFNHREPRHRDVRRVVEDVDEPLPVPRTSWPSWPALIATRLGVYRDQEVAVADASLVVLASHYRTRSILTLHHRHFSVVRPLEGGRFKLLP